MPSDLTAADLDAITDGHPIDVQRMAAEIRRRRRAAHAALDEHPALERFIAKPVNRISHPMVVEAIERIIEAHKAAAGE